MFSILILKFLFVVYYCVVSKYKGLHTTFICTHLHELMLKRLLGILTFPLIAQLLTELSVSHGIRSDFNLTIHPKDLCFPGNNHRNNRHTTAKTEINVVSEILSSKAVSNLIEDWDIHRNQFDRYNPRINFMTTSAITKPFEFLICFKN